MAKIPTGIDTSTLCEQLIGLEDCRVHVVTLEGESRRFWVRRAVQEGRPRHFEFLLRTSRSGRLAEVRYAEVKVLIRPSVRMA